MQAVLERCERIWDQASHNAFTDLIRFQDRWWCAFREGAAHVSPDGAIRVLTAGDDLAWTSAALFTADDADLRDAKLSVTPEGRLMLLAGAALHDGEPVHHRTYVWFSTDGKQWTARHEVGEPNFWLWRATWQDGAAYGVGYRKERENGLARLYRSVDAGQRFEVHVPRLFDVGYPNEATIRFGAQGEALCLLRRDGAENSAQLGHALAPYTNWRWHDLGVRVGGPELIQLTTRQWLAAVRLYMPDQHTAICGLNPAHASLTPLLRLPSGGDCSYAGMVWHDDRLWVSYYSSHEARTSIYLAVMRIA